MRTDGRFSKQLGFLLACLGFFAFGHAPLKAQEFELNFEERAEFEDVSLVFPMTMRLRALDETKLGVRVYANLGSLQEALPDLLDEPLFADCEHGVEMDLSEVTAVADTVFLKGVVIYREHSCREEDGQTIRSTTFKQNVDFTGRLGATFAENCMTMSTREVAFKVQGLVGFIGELVGALDGMNEFIEEEINTFLEDEKLCFNDLPPDLIALNPRLDNGGLVDYGGGLLGAQVAARVDVSPATIINMIASLHEQGYLNEPVCNC